MFCNLTCGSTDLYLPTPDWSEGNTNTLIFSIIKIYPINVEISTLKNKKPPIKY
jgi:hypothetical protein